VGGERGAGKEEGEEGGGRELGRWEEIRREGKKGGMKGEKGGKGGGNERRNTCKAAPLNRHAPPYTATHTHII